MTYRRNEAEADTRHLEITAKHDRALTVYLSIFLAGVVVMMSFLALSGKVSGDALLFLVGTVTGYLLLFIQKLVFSSRPSQLPDEG